MDIKQSNVVVVDLDKYLALNEFKQKMVEGKFYGGRDCSGNRYAYYAFKTNDEVVSELTQKNETQHKKIVELQNKLNNWSKEVDININKGRIEERVFFSNMSIWEFLRWRKGYKV